MIWSSSLTILTLEAVKLHHVISIAIVEYFSESCELSGHKNTHNHFRQQNRCNDMMYYLNAAIYKNYLHKHLAQQDNGSPLSFIIRFIVHASKGSEWQSLSYTAFLCRFFPSKFILLVQLTTSALPQSGYSVYMGSSYISKLDDKFENSFP